MILLFSSRVSLTSSARDFFGHIALDFEYVSELTIVRLRQEVLIGSRIDQLAYNSDLSARAPNTAFQNRVDVQLLTDLAQTLVGVFVSHRGCSRNHTQIRNL